MFDQYALLQYVKQQQFSHQVSQARLDVFKALKGGSFSPKMLTYFPDLDQQIEAIEQRAPMFEQLKNEDLPEEERTRLITQLKSQQPPYVNFDHEPAQISQVKKNH
jgi:hypothetical protein